MHISIRSAIDIACILMLSMLSVCCGSGGVGRKKQLRDSVKLSQHPDDKLHIQQATHDITDVSNFRVSYKDSDVITNDYFTKELKPVRENYFMINSIEKWTDTISRELQESTEGGEVTFYFLNKSLQKIIARIYGETFQHLNEYYLLDGDLSFVVERELKYNRPVYYDSIAMKENGDDQIFNINLSEYFENRSYFIRKKIIHQVNNQDCGAPFAADYMKDEEERILSELNLLLRHLRPNRN